MAGNWDPITEVTHGSRGVQNLMMYWWVSARKMWPQSQQWSYVFLALTHRYDASQPALKNKIPPVLLDIAWCLKHNKSNKFFKKLPVHKKVISHFKILYWWTFVIFNAALRVLIAFVYGKEWYFITHTKLGGLPVRLELKVCNDPAIFAHSLTGWRIREIVLWLVVWGLTHWGRVTHICVGTNINIGSDNGLSPERRQAIIWTNAGILLIGPLGTNFNEILIEIQTFSLKKIRLKMSSAKCCSFRLGLNVLNEVKRQW